MTERDTAVTTAMLVHKVRLSMAPTSENQHWVPRFLIRNFADTDGRVFCLNVQTDEVTKPPPKHAASGVGFNDFVMNGGAVSFEDDLERIETAAAPVLRHIVNSRSLAGLTDAQRTRVADFMATQSFRTEAFYKGVDQKAPRQQFGAVFTELWRSTFLLSAEIRRRKWALMVIEHADAFYLGDNPVVLQNTENPSFRGELGFDIKGVEAFMPIAPNCALYMPCATTCQEIVSGYETAAENIDRPELKAPVSTEFAALLELSERVLRNTKALYQSLTAGVPLVAGPENVENLNYLQCMWAHAAVYSNRRDFSFALRVFRENPQYRSTLKVRLTDLTGP
jgi:hypothetical protein